MIYTCGIYKITNPKGMIYIGKSIHIEKRWMDYKRLYCKNQRQIYNSLKKYGYKNHTFEIIHICEKDELDNLELHYITLFDCLNSGLNLMHNGKYGTVSKLEKEKIINRKLNKIIIQKRYISKKNKEIEDYVNSEEFLEKLKNIKSPLSNISICLIKREFTEEELKELPF